MKINDVYLSYDIYDSEQMDKVKKKAESIAEAYEQAKNFTKLSEIEKNNIKETTYNFFSEVFSEEKAVEVLGEDANITECICAMADFMTQSLELKDKIQNTALITKNHSPKKAVIHKRK